MGDSRRRWSPEFKRDAVALVRSSGRRTTLPIAPGGSRRAGGAGIGDDEPHRAQPAGAQAAQEPGPERLVLAVADVDTEDLPVAASGDPRGHHDGAGHDLTEPSSRTWT